MLADRALARRLEEAALNAWPARHQLLLDGWVVRLAGGYTKRANSATPLYPSGRPAEETLAACEELYAAHGLPTIVRIVDLSEPPGLDELLARRGYERIDPSEVLYRPLDDAEGHVDGALELLELDPWLAHYAELSGAPPATLPAHREILAAVPSQRALFALRDAGQVVACGMGVREGGFFGLFDIVVGAPFRRRGWGAALVSGMLGWGRRNGARHAYLQVVARNEPALALYRQLGFRQGYRYWYRVRRAARASGS